MDNAGKPTLLLILAILELLIFCLKPASESVGRILQMILIRMGRSLFKAVDASLFLIDTLFDLLKEIIQRGRQRILSRSRSR